MDLDYGADGSQGTLTLEYSIPKSIKALKKDVFHLKIQFADIELSDISA